MNLTGKERFKWELKKFIATRFLPMNPIDGHKDICIENECLNRKKRFNIMDEYWEHIEEWDLVGFLTLTNHKICHQMFWNAYIGRSRLFIQIQDVRQFKFEENEPIILQCSLLSLQMLDYDIMMFQAMESEDMEYSKEAKEYYRPYLFSYIIEADKECYTELQKLQNKAFISENYSENIEKKKSNTYLWFECTFRPNTKDTLELKGYVAESASNIHKIQAALHIIESPDSSGKIVNDILDAYTLSSKCKKGDDEFIDLLKPNLDSHPLSSIDIYKIGNGNCVFAQSENKSVSFFYDIGFNYRHHPKKLTQGANYNYSKTMREIAKKKPNFFILSHWDMDHIAGNAVLRKDIFEKDWFAPDPVDACANALRLAKYLDMKDHLFLVDRGKGRLIGKEIEVSDSSNVLATYKLYMGEKASCDRSRANCEGIVIEYTDMTKSPHQTMLMMGDVNYTSFNKALSNERVALFADTRYDYIIVPHHGSERTDYHLITDSGKSVISGKMAVICCSDDKKINRPNKNHLNELEVRFDKVCLTEKNEPNVTIGF